MATYKVVDAEQLNADMSSVADSIRTKGGTTDALAWPDGYKTAIDSIPAGGGAPSLQSKSVTYTANGTATITPDAGYDGLKKVDVTVNVASSTAAANIITFEYTPTATTLDISHDVLVGVGIDTEDKFFKIIGISIFPKNGDVDWFYVSYGGALNKTSFVQQLPHMHNMPNSGTLSFYNLSGVLPYNIAMQTTDAADNAAVNKTFVVTLLLSE